MRRIEADQIAVMSIHYQFYPLTRFLDTARRLNVSAVDLWAVGRFATAADISAAGQRLGIRRPCGARGGG